MRTVCGFVLSKGFSNSLLYFYNKYIKLFPSIYLVSTLHLDLMSSSTAEMPSTLSSIISEDASEAVSNLTIYPGSHILVDFLFIFKCDSLILG